MHGVLLVILTAGVTFTASGTNAAKNATAIFTAPGIYDLRVVATDTLGLSAIADITVAVVQTLTGIVITPASVAVMTGGANQYSAVANDQFGVAMPFQPALFWSATAGSINANSGFYTAPAMCANGHYQRHDWIGHGQSICRD